MTRLSLITFIAIVLLSTLSNASSVRPKPRPDPRPKVDFCLRAFLECRFRFAGFNGLPTFPLFGPDRAFTTLVVSKDPHERLGVLNTNRIVPEFILPHGAAVPITAFGNPRFTPTHFKPFSIRGTRGSGVGHQTFQGNQFALARHRCVRIFFTQYQLLSNRFPFNVIANINAPFKTSRSCVVFRTR